MDARQAGLPTGTVTLLFTDIEGSTRILQAAGASFPALLQEHARIIREACARHRGYEVSTEGDSFFVAFTETGDGVRAALEAQRALTSHAWPPGLAVRVRMGLHTGEPIVMSDDYVGLDVHRAARIAAAAHGGQIVLSETTRDLVAPEAIRGVEFRDLGSHRLKDLDRPERIFQLVADGIPERFPALRSLEVPSNLPVQHTPLVGRERELTSLRALLSEQGARLVTLTGAGGTGKTRLALAAAERVRSGFPDGIFFVPLASLDHESQVATAVSEALSVEAGDRAPSDAIVAHLRDRRVLLVLDNFEHVLGAALLVADLLQRAPRVAVLVTSRALLHLAPEVEFAVPPLGLPPRGARDRATIAGSDAVALFVERARAVKPGFEVTEANAAAVADICARLEGLPLAIELAAARSKLLPPEAMLRRLDRSLKLLTGGPSDLPSRQRTLRGAIEWSVDLLEERERRLFRSLAVFAGGWTLESAEAVLAPDDPIELLDDLASLVDKSLVRHDDVGGDGRFWMLNMLREFALELLESAGDDARLRREHARYFTALGERAEPHLHGPEQGTWFGRLDAEHDNLRAALRWWLRDEATTDPEARVSALRLVAGLGRYWYTHGHVVEGSSWLEAALARDDGSDPDARARALHALGVLMEQKGDLERARILFEDSIELSRAGDRWARVAASLNSLGVVARSSCDPGRARELLQESITVRRRIGDHAGEANSLCNLGIVAMDEGDAEAAEQLFEESLAIDRRHDNAWGIAVNTSNLAAVALERGGVERAQSLLDEALNMFEQLGETDGLVEGLERAAAIAAARGDHERAARLVGAAAAQRERAGTPLGPADRSFVDRRLTSTRAALGPAGFRRASREGGEMTLEQALRQARRDSRREPQTT